MDIVEAYKRLVKAALSLEQGLLLNIERLFGI